MFKEVNWPQENTKRNGGESLFSLISLNYPGIRKFLSLCSYFFMREFRDKFKKLKREQGNSGTPIPLTFHPPPLIIEKEGKGTYVVDEC